MKRQVYRSHPSRRVRKRRKTRVVTYYRAYMRRIAGAHDRWTQLASYDAR